MTATFYKNFALSILGIILFSQIAFSQEQPTGSLNEGTIASQFDYLNAVSNNFQEYKVVKKTFMEKIKSNVTDSLDRYKKELTEIHQQIEANNKQMKAIEEKMALNNQELQHIQEARDSFTFLGVNIHKATYQTIVWSIIAALTLISLLFIFKYSQSFKVIRTTQKNLTETVEEFEQHRKNTLERERKLKRELIDATNGKVS